MNRKQRRTNSQKGFTLLEILIVVAIISILFAVLLFGDITQLFKGYDAVRKSDLNRIKIALENYYSDYDCYPSAGMIQDFLSQCDNTTAFSPWLPKIPCDPRDHTTPYQVVTDGLECAQKFRLYTQLDNSRDKSVYETSCANGCGPEMTYNYTVPSNNLANRRVAPTPTPTGEPSEPETPLFYCASWHVCANLDPELTCGSSPTYTDYQCDGSCETNICTPILR
jgi:prepilin-type N-terminal cleavage/methylation domain-containing protein